MWIVMFSEVAPFADSVPTILSPIVASSFFPKRGMKKETKYMYIIILLPNMRRCGRKKLRKL